MLGGLCVGVGRIYSKTNNVLLSAGILFVAAGEMVKVLPVRPRTLSLCGEFKNVDSLERSHTYQILVHVPTRHFYG